LGLARPGVDTTVCAIVKNPKSFVQDAPARAPFGRFDQFSVKTAAHRVPVEAYAFVSAMGEAKSGPLANCAGSARAHFTGTLCRANTDAVTLDKSKDFKQFDNLVSQAHSKGGMCLGCRRYEVTGDACGRWMAWTAPAQRDKAGQDYRIRRPFGI